jgi:predicted nucleic acid-binding protein
LKFWDSSAVVPLLIAEPKQKRMLSLLDRDPVMAVWWGTPVEVYSAIARLERSRHLGTDKASGVLDRLETLAASWVEVLPTLRLRRTAQRLLRVHPLRAADALQLAAAVIAFEGEYSQKEFVCLDEELGKAARREGFRVVP